MHTFMTRAFKEAAKATNQVKTNPKVGALIVRGDRVISAGHHATYGEAHAEINALNAASEPVEGATMVVTLEPCSHHGKTPPCVDAIIAAGINKVLIGTPDPNPQVAGTGIQMLKDAGIEVDVLDTMDAQRTLNGDYLKKITTGMPYITLKSAVSLDGKMALKNGQSQWITSGESRHDVQRLRKNASAVLTGIGTVRSDNPKLTVHDDSAHSPVRIILDPRLDTPLHSNVVRTARDVPTWIMTRETASEKAGEYRALGVRLILVNGQDDQLDLDEVLRVIAAAPIKHLLVESGPRLTTSFLKAGYIDQWILMMAPKLLGGDAQSMIGPLDLHHLNDALAFRLTDTTILGGDIALTLTPERTD